MKCFIVTVTTTATLVVPADNDTREVYLHNGSGGSIYLGGSNVTSTTGYHLANNEHMAIKIPGGSSLYAITAASSHDLTILRPSDA